MGLYCISYFSLFSFSPLIYSFHILVINLILVIYALDIIFCPFLVFHLPPTPIYSFYLLAVNLVLVICTTDTFLCSVVCFLCPQSMSQVHVMYDVLWGKNGLIFSSPFTFSVVLIIICPTAFCICIYSRVFSPNFLLEYS